MLVQDVRMFWCRTLGCFGAGRWCIQHELDVGAILTLCHLGYLCLDVMWVTLCGAILVMPPLDLDLAFWSSP